MYVTHLQMWSLFGAIEGGGQSSDAKSRPCAKGNWAGNRKVRSPSRQAGGTAAIFIAGKKWRRTLKPWSNSMIKRQGASVAPGCLRSACHSFTLWARLEAACGCSIELLPRLCLEMEDADRGARVA